MESAATGWQLEKCKVGEECQKSNVESHLVTWLASKLWSRRKISWLPLFSDPPFSGRTHMTLLDPRSWVVSKWRVPWKQPTKIHFSIHDVSVGLCWRTTCKKHTRNEYPLTAAANIPSPKPRKIISIKENKTGALTRTPAVAVGSIAPPACAACSKASASPGGATWAKVRRATRRTSTESSWSRLPTTQRSTRAGVGTRDGFLLKQPWQQ